MFVPRIAALVIAALLPIQGLAADTLNAREALGRYKAAWAAVRTYTAMVRAREVSGDRVQERVYRFWFAKPHDTRMEIISGSGRGEIAVWRGGKTVQVRAGGPFSFVRLRFNLTDPPVTSVRGATIAQVNFGAFYDHLTHLKTRSLIARRNSGATTSIAETVADPAADGGVTEEVVVLGGNGLPVEYDVYAHARQVKKVTFTGVRVNEPVPQSMFRL